MPGWVGRAGAALADAAGTLVDLVFPTRCAGCEAAVTGAAVCPTCAGALAVAVPHPVRPAPAPAGLPPCVALADYADPLRELLLNYKECGRHDLARPLGHLLAAVVLSDPAAVPLALVPVPATARAARDRYGDHLYRMAGHTVAALRRAGRPAQLYPAVTARPRPDSAGLGSADRARAAVGSFRVRPSAIAPLHRAVAAGAHVVVVDDIVTTGATLATISQVLAAAGVPVHRCAVLAATQRWAVCADPA